MYAKQEISASRTIYKGFPFPKPNINGVCDNLQQPEFMHNSESSCVTSFLLTPEGCENLNPLLATTTLTLLRGPQPPSSNPGVKLSLPQDGFYLYSNSANTYIPTNSTISASSFSSSGNSCTCNGVLKEVHYSIKVSTASGTMDTNNEPYFKIESVTALPVVMQEPFIGQCGSRVAVSQSYSIKFETSASSSQFRSGNPGYINGLPLLVGNRLGNAIEAYERGFMLRGADDSGQCLDTISEFQDFGDQVINFGENMIYGCAKSLSLSDLQNYCKTQDNFKSQGIYENLAAFEYFGQFGNADIYKIQVINISFHYIGLETSSSYGFFQSFECNRLSKLMDRQRPKLFTLFGDQL